MTNGSQVDRNTELIGKIAARLMSIEFTSEEVFNNLYELTLNQTVDLSNNSSIVLVRRKHLWLKLFEQAIRLHLMRNVLAENFKKYASITDKTPRDRQNDDILLQRMVNFPEKLVQSSVKLSE